MRYQHDSRSQGVFESGDVAATNRVRGLTVRVSAPVRALLAVTIGTVVLVGYVVLLANQGPNGSEGSREAFFVTYWLALVVGGLAGSRALSSRSVVASPIMLGVATGYLASGFLAIFSVGMPLLIAAILALSTVGPGHPRMVSALAVVLPVVVLALGLGLTR